MNNLIVLSHSSLHDAVRAGLLSPEHTPNIFFTERRSFNEDFIRRFSAQYGRDPYLNADLGYYGIYLLAEGLRSGSVVSYLKSGRASVRELPFQFDEHNVYSGVGHEVWTIENGKMIRAQ